MGYISFGFMVAAAVLLVLRQNKMSGACCIVGVGFALAELLTGS